MTAEYNKGLESLLEEKMSRRDLFKRVGKVAAGAAAMAAIPSLLHGNETSASNSKYIEINAVRTSDTLQSLEFKDYRDQIREICRASVEDFLADKNYESMIATANQRQNFTNQIMGEYRSGPIMQFVNADGSLSHEGMSSSDVRKAPLHLADASDPAVSYPNLSIIDVMSPIDDAKNPAGGPVWNGNFVYLGRDPKILHSTRNGSPEDVIVDVFYLGGFYLAEKEPLKLNKYVLPIFNAWRAADVATDGKMPLTIYESSVENPRLPFPVSEILSASEQIPKLDDLAGNAIAGVGLGFRNSTDQDTINFLIGRGDPEEMNTQEFWKSATDGARDAYQYVRYRELKYARKNDYCLWGYMPDPTPIDIAEVYNFSKADKGKIPSWEETIKKDVLESKDFTEMIFADLLTLNPR